MIHVVVIAPTQALRVGLHSLLESDEGLQVIGEAATLQEVLPLPPETDVLVLAGDLISRPDLERALPETHVVAVLSLVSDDLDATRMLSGLPLRAWGVLKLDTTAEELLAAIRALQEGLLVGSPELFEPLLTNYPSEGEFDEEAVVEALTERESEVLQLLAQGLANKQIGAALGISEHTVKFHVSAIYAKLGASSRTEAVRLGVRRGLIVL